MQKIDPSIRPSGEIALFSRCARIVNDYGYDNDDNFPPLNSIFRTVPVGISHAAPEPGTELSIPEKFGCSIDGKFYLEGAQVPSNPNKPCELCYCIKNRTSCLMQECTLHIDGCTPIYNKGSCCPVRYNCGK